MRQAWQLGQIKHAGARILILSDISRNTRRMRGCMHPLLDQIKASGATYSWGHPFHLKVKKENHSFFLHTQDQLQDLFIFLGCEPIQVPNWLDFT